MLDPNQSSALSTSPQPSPQISEFRSSPPTYVIIVDIYFPYHAFTHYTPQHHVINTSDQRRHALSSAISCTFCPSSVIASLQSRLAVPQACIETLGSHSEEIRAHDLVYTHFLGKEILMCSNSTGRSYDKADSSPPTTSANMPNGERAMPSGMRRARRRRGEYRSLYKRD